MQIVEIKDAITHHADLKKKITLNVEIINITHHVKIMVLIMQHVELKGPITLHTNSVYPPQYFREF